MDSNEKTCAACHQTKRVPDDFSIRKGKYVPNVCKLCEREKAKANRRSRYATTEGRQAILEQNLAYRQQPEAAQHIRDRVNSRYAADLDFKRRRKVSAKKWKVENPERNKQNKAAWFQSNYGRLREAWNERFRTDPAFRLRNNLRHAIWEALKAGGGHKGGRSILTYLPYSMEDLRGHLERLWEPWMSWENYGVLDHVRRTWQIDHMTPQALLPFSDFSDVNFLRCWALSNLRPVESRLNLEKGCRPAL